MIIHDPALAIPKNCLSVSAGLPVSAVLFEDNRFFLIFDIAALLESSPASNFESTRPPVHSSSCQPDDCPPSS